MRYTDEVCRLTRMQSDGHSFALNTRGVGMGPDINAVISSSAVAQRQVNAPSCPLTVEQGDVVVSLEVAGIWRSGPGLTAPTTQTLAEYHLSVLGQTDVEHIFELYDTAVADGEALAALRKVRLFYSEGKAVTLLKDYRTAHRL